MEKEREKKYVLTMASYSYKYYHGWSSQTSWTNALGKLPDWKEWPGLDCQYGWLGRMAGTDGRDGWPGQMAGTDGRDIDGTDGMDRMDGTLLQGQY